MRSLALTLRAGLEYLRTAKFPGFSGVVDRSPAGRISGSGPNNQRSSRWEFRRYGVSAMSRRCDLTGKTAQTGHKVSHSNRKTKRRFLPNLCSVTLTSDALGRSVRLRVSANALKSIDHRGGLDAFLAKAKDEQLAPRALELKRQILRKRAG